MIAVQTSSFATKPVLGRPPLTIKSASTGPIAISFAVGNAVIGLPSLRQRALLLARAYAVFNPSLGQPILSVGGTVPNPVTYGVRAVVELFGPIYDGVQTFDLRRDDRPYKVGDSIRYEEFRYDLSQYTGRVCTRKIRFIMRKYNGLAGGYCILGLER